MDSVSDFLKVCRIDEDLPSITERYFTAKLFPDTNQCALLHSNRLCLITIAPTHPILTECLNIHSIEFNSVGNVNRLSNKVSGKFKRGAQKLKEKSVICKLKCDNDSEYILYSCVAGKLVEINEKLIENPNLLKEKPWSDGYVGIIMPFFVPTRRKDAYKKPLPQTNLSQ
ncbi:protein Abitram [Parasteatoda tepidariorum]|uniref:protein Abitram n=1 Tax=Parasteatoda tepidariorum TaxID=114398 RepID=UPI00077F95D4|nr:protein Abitram [Parasteatoda tepidariorum]XP_015906226.1 protein Abitram [Parasteatoda tepidariorum]XP_015906230.1 protein Abitram [Parasteatoda tepidariorum]